VEDLCITPHLFNFYGKPPEVGSNKNVSFVRVMPFGR